MVCHRFNSSRFVDTQLHPVLNMRANEERVDFLLVNPFDIEK